MERVEGCLADLMQTVGEDVVDVFLGSASFESRCLSVVENLDVSRVDRAIVGCSAKHIGAVQRNFDIMEGMFGGKGIRLDLYADDPVGSFRNMGQVFDGLFENQPKRVVMDITTFTREALLMLLLFLHRNMRSQDSLELLYVPAMDYSVGEEGSRKWLSKGISEVRSVLGFPGEMKPSRPTHMIVMAGFEFERAVEMVNICEPSFVSIGFGDRTEDATAYHQDLNEEVVERLSRAFGEVDSFTFRAYDIGGSRIDLANQIRRHADCNVVVAPMHTKISTVGAALLAIDDDRVQLCYAPAKIYNVEGYSVASEIYLQFWFQNVAAVMALGGPSFG